MIILISVRRKIKFSQLFSIGDPISPHCRHTYHRFPPTSVYTYVILLYDIACYIIIMYNIVICNLDFDVRMCTVNRVEQTRWRTVSDERPAADGFASCGGDSVVVVGGRAFVVPVARVVGPQRPDGQSDRVPDHDPRTPDHGEGKHFQRLGHRYGHHHVVAASDQHGHRDVDSGGRPSVLCIVIYIMTTTSSRTSPKTRLSTV